MEGLIGVVDVKVVTWVTGGAVAGGGTCLATQAAGLAVEVQVCCVVQVQEVSVAATVACVIVGTRSTVGSARETILAIPSRIVDIGVVARVTLAASCTAVWVGGVTYGASREGSIAK